MLAPVKLRTDWLAVIVIPLLATGVVGRRGGEDAAELHAAGVAAHLERRLAEAAALYDAALDIERPADPSAQQAAIVRRFAPRISTTAAEPFGLKDAAAIVHPTSRLIAYHLFWDDDIDFPDDNDPCDHEVIWVKYSGDGARLEGVWTYFHGRVLAAPATAVASSSNRPRVDVQWGKHGSLPEGWRGLSIIPEVTEIPDGIPVSELPVPLERYLEGSFQKLSTSGRRLPDHPIALRLGWPRRFEGRREDFLTFPRAVDLLPLIGSRRSILVSRFNSGTLNRWLIPFNFRPKIEWPEMISR